MSDIEAAVHLLRAPSIKERLAEFVTWPQAGPELSAGIDWKGVADIAEAQFSDGELVLVNAACALFTGRTEPIVGDPKTHAASLPRLLQWLDEPSWLRVLQAVQLKRGEQQPIAGGRIYVGRRLVSGESSSAIVWVFSPQGIGSELSLHTPSGSAGPKSPDGHSWGYGGSGPSQLAMDLLWDLTDQEPHPTCYQEFKREFLASMDADNWALPEARLIMWLEAFEGERFVRPGFVR